MKPGNQYVETSQLRAASRCKFNLKIISSQTFPIGSVTHQVDRLGRPNMRMAKKRKAESHTARPVRNVEKQFRSCWLLAR